MDEAVQAGASNGALYGAAYYETHCSANDCDVPYSWDEPMWVDMFRHLANEIVVRWSPRRTFDAGCAIGLLVGSLWDKGVEAYGRDISPFAISQVRPDVRQYCSVGSVADPIDGRYDMITCIEVLEHMPEDEAHAAIAAMCQATDRILFSSIPDGFDEPTHINLHPLRYWVDAFAQRGFVPAERVDATFLAPHAMCFERGHVPKDSDDWFRSYVDLVSTRRQVMLDAKSHTEEITELHAQLRDTSDELAGSRARITELSHGIEVLRLDRDAIRTERERLVTELAQARAEQLTLEEKLEKLAAEQRKKLDEEGVDVVGSMGEMQRLLARGRELGDALAQRDAEVALLQSQVIAARGEADGLRARRTYRYSRIPRGVYRRVRSWALASAPAPTVTPLEETAAPIASYSTWVDLFDTLDDTRRAEITRGLARLTDLPLVSIVMPVYNPPVLFLHAAIESVRAQMYPRWELCICDDASTLPGVTRLLSDYAEQDERISIVTRNENGHISRATNDALALAKGEWIALMDHDDILREHALAVAVLALSKVEDAEVLYSDEDNVDEAGVRSTPYFKPDFDPVLLRGQNYMAHLCMYRRSTIVAAGGMRAGYEGSQDWDLALRVTERMDPRRILHVGKVLYHWRAHEGSTARNLAAKDYAADAGRRALEDHLRRMNRPGRVRLVHKTGYFQVNWTLPRKGPSVGIVIPTRDGRMLDSCLRSVSQRTLYRNFSVLVVDNGSVESHTQETLEEFKDTVRVICDGRPFNYSRLNNLAVAQLDTDFVCLLNDDVEVLAPEWLGAMVGEMEDPSVGAVGAMLYYPDSRIQHGGVILGLGGVAGHAHRLLPRGTPGYFGRAALAQCFSAVTGACMLVRRSAWEQVGGLDEENLPVSFNDVDLCLRLKAAGWNIVWTPRAELFHYESLSRGSDEELVHRPRAQAETRYMRERWGPQLDHDPAYNDNLTLVCGDWSLSWPPRAAG